MTVSRTLLTTVFLLGLATGGRTVLAEAPSGSITNLVVGATNSVWEIALFEGLQYPAVVVPLTPKLSTNYWSFLQAPTNTASAVPEGNSQLQLSLSAPYVQDGRGRLAGKGTNDVSLSFLNAMWTGDLFNPWTWTNLLDVPAFVGKYVTSGSVVSDHEKSMVNFRTRASGQSLLNGKLRSLTATKAVVILIDPLKHTLRGSDANFIVISGRGSVSTGAPFTGAIPAYLGNGHWTLVLNFDPVSPATSTRLSGNATVTLNSGTVYTLSFTGRYIPTKNQSQLLLKGVANLPGTADGRGANLSVTLTDGQVTRILGRILGRSINQR